MKIEVSIDINNKGKESYAIVTKDKKQVLNMSAIDPYIVISAAQNILMMSTQPKRADYDIPPLIG